MKIVERTQNIITLPWAIILLSLFIYFLRENFNFILKKIKKKKKKEVVSDKIITTGMAIYNNNNKKRWQSKFLFNSQNNYYLRVKQ